MAYKYLYNRKISKDIFFSLRDEDTTHRKCFIESGVQQEKQRPTFSVSFEETLVPLYETMTGNSLEFSERYGNYWHFLSEEADIEEVEEWEEEQGTRVFLRDCLFCSIALDMHGSGDKRTSLGEDFYQLKYQAREDIEEMVEGIAQEMINTIENLPFYNNATIICAVPPGRQKKLIFHL